MSEQKKEHKTCKVCKKRKHTPKYDMCYGCRMAVVKKENPDWIRCLDCIKNNKAVAAYHDPIYYRCYGCMLSNNRKRERE